MEGEDGGAGEVTERGGKERGEDEARCHPHECCHDDVRDAWTWVGVMWG